MWCTPPTCTGAACTYHARKLILATGYYDRPNYMNVPGEDLPKVLHYYREPHPFFNLDVLVVGGKNSAAIAALELWRHGARVTLVHRARGNQALGEVLDQAGHREPHQGGQVKAYFNSTVKEIAPDHVVLNTPEGEVTLANDWVFALTGLSSRFRVPLQPGIQIRGDADKKPVVNPKTLESNVPGIYLAGVIVAGMRTSEIFIENGRFHGQAIAADLKEKLKARIGFSLNDDSAIDLPSPPSRRRCRGDRQISGGNLSTRVTAWKTLILAGLLLSAFTFVSVAQEAHSWGYSGAHGPDHWSEVSAICGTGKEQSPIDIVNPKKEKLPAIDFSYHATPLKVINNGHTIQVNYGPGSSIVRDGKTYDLLQFHFHHMSENAIKGKHDSDGAAPGPQSQDGSLAVVAVMLKEGKANKVVDTVWSNIPAEEGKENAPASVDRRCRRTAAGQARLLHVSRVADHAAVQRGRAVAGDGRTDDVVEGTNRQVRRASIPTTRVLCSRSTGAGAGEQITRRAASNKIDTGPGRPVLIAASNG